MTKPDAKTLSRRAVVGALGLGAVACRRGWAPAEDDPTSRAIAKEYVPGSEAYATHEERWFVSSCAQCAAGCGVRVRVVEGRAVRIEGHADNPLNRGGIGARGLAALQALYDPDRITGPRVRLGGVLVPISWDDALAILAADLAALREAGEPERLLVWCGLERGPVHDLLERFCGAFGTPNFVDGRPGRSAVLAQAMAETSGVAEPPVYDWENARFVLGLEAGLVEDSCQSVYFTRMTARLRRGTATRARFVHAGPVHDLSAHNADEWIRIRAGTGGALALGIARVLLEREPTLVPEGDGGAAFRALLAGFAPARVESITGVAPRVVERLATELWDSRPALVVVDERSVAYSNGLDTARAALGLNAMLGSTVVPAPVAPLRAWPRVEADAIAVAGLARPRLGGDGPPAHETLPEAIEAQPPRIALLHHANPAYARQQPARWRRALDRIDRIVSFSPYRDETVDELADLVLPDHTFLERRELAIPAPAIDRAIVGVRVPVIAPVHDTRSTGDVVLELARRVGGTVAAAMPWPAWRDALEERLQGLHEARRGSIVAASLGDFVREIHRAGFWIDDAPAAAATRTQYPTTYREPEWHGDPSRYPLRLVVHRPLGYAEGGGANQPWLRTLRPHPGARPWSFAARVHPASAPGIHDGQAITLESEHGAIELTAHLDDLVEPGHVVVPLGAGHTAFGRWARGFGANVLDLVRPGAAPDTGANVLCATRVRIAGGAP